MSESKIKCFVIMPFSKTESRNEEEWTRHYERFLKPLIEEVPNVEAFRSSPLRENVQEQIIKDLIFSPIVVADLTDCKPNVFWELGVRQSFKHGTITIAYEKTTIPFHLEHKSIIKYKKDPSIDDEFKARFRKAIKDCISKPQKPDSPVLIAITGRGTIYSLIHNEENKRKLDGLKDEVIDNLSLLDLLYKSIEKGERVQYHFKTVNLDNLLTYHYLDETDQFYFKIREYCVRVNILNNQINEWLIQPQEELLLGRKKMNYDIINEILRLLNEVKKKLEKEL